MTYKLVNIYGTQYFYLTYVKDLQYLFSSVISIRKGTKTNPHAGSELMEQVFTDVRNGVDITFDLADARITPDTSAVILHFMQEGLSFIDSKDKGRMDILVNNYAAMENIKRETTPMPVYDGSISTPNYIKSLRTDVVYKIPDEHLKDKVLYNSLIYMSTVLQPKFQFVLTSSYDLFSMIYDYFILEDLLKYDEFYFTIGTISRVLKFEGGLATLENNRKVDIEQALSYGSLVPTAFGKERLYGKDPWMTIFDSCNQTVSRWREAQTHSIDTFIEHMGG